MHEVCFDGALLKRGFWLYIWEVTTPKGEKLYYVGRTGDSSSINAQSPFNRMGQHLGTARNSSMLRNHLRNRRIPRLASRYRLVAYGPLFSQARSKDTHHQRRDIVAGLEKALADTLRDVGCTLLNEVKCRKPIHDSMFQKIKRGFAAEFPELRHALAHCPRPRRQRR